MTISNWIFLSFSIISIAIYIAILYLTIVANFAILQQVLQLNSCNFANKFAKYAGAGELKSRGNEKWFQKGEIEL